GDDGKIEAPGASRLKVDRRRPRRSHAGADDIRANDEISVGVDRLARADHDFPPACLAGHGMLVRHVLIAGERVADENGVRSLAVEHAISLIRDLEWRKLDTGVELQRTVSAKVHDLRTRVFGFADAIGCISR